MPAYWGVKTTMETIVTVNSHAHESCNSQVSCFGLDAYGLCALHSLVLKENLQTDQHCVKLAVTAIQQRAMTLLAFNTVEQEALMLLSAAGLFSTAGAERCCA